MNRIDLKERIATSGAFTPEERDFLLDAINAVPDLSDAQIDQPGNYMGRIESIWAFLSVGEGGEGVLGGQLEEGAPMLPLIAADKRRLDQVRPWAVQMSRVAKITVRLAQFTTRKDVEIIRP